MPEDWRSKLMVSILYLRNIVSEDLSFPDLTESSEQRTGWKGLGRTWSHRAEQCAPRQHLAFSVIDVCLIQLEGTGIFLRLSTNET